MIRPTSVFLLFVLLFIFCSCTSKNQYSNDNNLNVTNQDSISIVDTAKVKVFNCNDDQWDARECRVDMDSLNYYIKLVKQEISTFKEAISKMDSLEINKLVIDGIFPPKEKLLRSLECVTMPVVMRSSGVFDTIYNQPSDLFVIKELGEVGIRSQYIGEGYSELTTNLNFYIELLKPYIDLETEDFLNIRNAQDDVIFMDAGLVVSLEYLAERCLHWEQFLNQYQNSKFRKQAIDKYHENMTYLLFCFADNTLTFDSETNKIENYNYEKIQDIGKSILNTYTSNIIDLYLKRLNEKDLKYSSELEKEISDYVYKIYRVESL